MSLKFDEDVILIAGPTASGKTALAIEIAKANHAEIINTDSMQVYQELQVITARPSAEEEAECPHHLFGYISGREDYSVGRWLEDAEKTLNSCRSNGNKTVFVGGTGLYFNNLIGGLSPIPEIEPEIRDKWRNGFPGSVDELHQQLARLDPKMASLLEPADRQRITRALEVIESTGKSISFWQNLPVKPVLPETLGIKKILLMPERTLLHERIEKRFDQMVDTGGLDEVAYLLEQEISADKPIMKAIGVPQLASYLRKECTLSAAVEKAKAATRQYAKRQSTWFRNSFDSSWSGKF